VGEKRRRIFVFVFVFFFFGKREGIGRRKIGNEKRFEEDENDNDDTNAGSETRILL
jgi:hypothetical protein